MNELTDLLKSSPQAALVGATVYLILTTRRIESRVEELAAINGLAPRKKKRKQWTGVLFAAIVALVVGGCKSAMTKTRPKNSMRIPEQTRTVVSPGAAAPGSAKVQSPP